jgi:hypothetical protein
VCGAGFTDPNPPAIIPIVCRFTQLGCAVELSQTTYRGVTAILQETAAITCNLVLGGQKSRVPGRPKSSWICHCGQAPPGPS